MTAINPNSIISRANQMHANAKDGVARIGNGRYTLTFNRSQGIYEAFDSRGNVIGPGFNTRKVTEARRLLRQYIED